MLQIFSGAGVTPIVEDTTLWNARCLLIEINQVRRIWGEYLSGLFEVAWPYTGRHVAFVIAYDIAGPGLGGPQLLGPGPGPGRIY